MNALTDVEKAEARAYRRSVVSKLHRWIRIVFLAEVFVSAMGFFFFPFREADTVQSFDPNNRNDHYQYLSTKGGSSFMFNNDGLKHTHLAAGDTVYLEKNLFYKTEAVFVPAAGDSFFPASKMAWIFIHAIFLVTVIASFFFSIPKDIAVQQGLSVLLEIICVLYLFI